LIPASLIACGFEVRVGAASFDLFLVTGLPIGFFGEDRGEGAMLNCSILVSEKTVISSRDENQDEKRIRKRERKDSR
jgi:hypothetical protein